MQLLPHMLLQHGPIRKHLLAVNALQLPHHLLQLIDELLDEHEILRIAQLQVVLLGEVSHVTATVSLVLQPTEQAVAYVIVFGAFRFLYGECVLQSQPMPQLAVLFH